jgi:CRISPR/Cas system CMR-associated protein Cmr5 small subunit
MKIPPRHLDRLRAQRLHGIVLQRHATTQDDEVWTAYVGLVERLPQLLRNHGLRLTIDYLAVLDGRGGSAAAAARALREDWLITPGQNHDGWHLQGWYGAGTSGPGDAGPDVVDERSEYRRASRLALAEADWLRRFATSVRPDGADEPDANAAGPAQTEGA